MRKRNAARLVVLALAATAVLIGSSLPAAAGPSNYNVEYDSGRIRVVRFGIGTNFDTPGSSVAGCPGATTISGVIDDTGGVDTISGNLSISSPFTFGANSYILTLTGSTGAGANRGDYTGGPAATFSIKNFNAGTCTAGTRVCGSSGTPGATDGTLNLTAGGGVAPGSTVPLTTGEEIYVTANGVFTSAGCVSGSVFGLIIATNATISLNDNPNDCYLNPADTPTACAPNGPDPGAIFTQI